MHLAFFDQGSRPQPAPDALARDRLATELRARGHQVTVVSGAPLPERLPPGRRLSRPDAWEGLQRLRTLTAAQRIDALYVTSCDGRAVASLFQQEFPQRPVLLGFRGPAVEPNLGLSLLRWQHSDPRITIVVPSHELRERLRACPQRIEVIPNGVERPLPRLTPASAVRAGLGLSPSDMLWVIPGVLRREQVIIKLIRCLAAAPQHAPSRLVLAGAALDRDRHERLVATVAESPLRDRIVLLGACARADLLSHAAAADLCLFLPGEEGGRSALLEAALLGTPVLAAAAPSHARLAELPWVRLLESPRLLDFVEAAARLGGQLCRGDPAQAQALYTVAAEADALLALCTEPNSDLLTERGTERGLPALLARAGAPASGPADAPVLLVARGAGRADADLAWAADLCAGLGAHGSAARVVLGTELCSEPELVDLLSSKTLVLCVPDAWLEAARPEAAVLIDNILSQQPHRAVLGVGLRSAGLLAAIGGRSRGTPGVLWLDALDAANLRAETSPADVLAIGLASLIVVSGCTLPQPLSGFTRGEAAGLTLFTAPGAEAPLLSLPLLKQLAASLTPVKGSPCMST